MLSMSLIETLIHARGETYVMWDANLCELWFTLTLQLCQYIDLLVDKYGLRVLSKKKSIIDLDNLYLLLYTHWVFDDLTFKNERQRVQVAIDLLTVAFFDCRPCSLFDTRVKFDNSKDLKTSINEIAIANSLEAIGAVSNRDDDTGKAIDSTGKVDDHFNNP